MKWCQTCALDSNKGFFCPICKRYQCPKCEKKNSKLAGPPVDIEVAERIFMGDVAMITSSGTSNENGSGSDTNISVASSNSWHPEADMNVYKKKCQHCERVVCQCFDSSCYKSCAACGEASCNECIKKMCVMAI